MARQSAAIALSALVLAALASSTTHAAPARSARAVTVQLHGQLNVAPATLFDACADTAMLYRDAGVDLVWVSEDAELDVVLCGDRDACATGTAPPTMGRALINRKSRMGRVAYVYHDRVEDLAAAAGVDPANILGHVMAHEIAHLLGVAHAETGLMRAGWDTMEVSLAASGLLHFSPMERAFMQKSVASLQDGAATSR